jgi:phosphatidylserine synthase
MFAALQEQILVVMDWICPNRWLLRTILFVVFIGIAAVLIISNWYYELRKYLVQLPFVLLCIGSLAALMLVFVADPYFKAYQVPILLGFMALIIWILLVVRWLTMEGDKP